MNLFRRVVTPHFKQLAFFLPLLGIATFASEPSSTQPWEASAVSLESGQLWEIGHLTPLPYQLVPTQLSWRSAQFLHHEYADGSRLVVRHRVTLLATWIKSGPESHYIALDGSPSIEWWNKAATWTLFGGVGGGLGGLDSRGVKGGQGQDFTLNWFMRGGIEHLVASNLRLSVGVMFNHMSNGGQTKPNPGIDALGFAIGAAWSR